jgi:hypothetical protein
MSLGIDRERTLSICDSGCGVSAMVAWSGLG